jgi:hypothetical protein
VSSRVPEHRRCLACLTAWLLPADLVPASQSPAARWLSALPRRFQLLAGSRFHLSPPAVQCDIPG